MAIPNPFSPETNYLDMPVQGLGASIHARAIKQGYNTLPFFGYCDVATKPFMIREKDPYAQSCDPTVNDSDMTDLTHVASRMGKYLARIHSNTAGNINNLKDIKRWLSTDEHGQMHKKLYEFSYRYAKQNQQDFYWCKVRSAQSRTGDASGNDS